MPPADGSGERPHVPRQAGGPRRHCCGPGREAAWSRGLGRVVAAFPSLTQGKMGFTESLQRFFFEFVISAPSKCKYFQKKIKTATERKLIFGTCGFLLSLLEAFWTVLPPVFQHLPYFFLQACCCTLCSLRCPDSLHSFTKLTGTESRCFWAFSYRYQWTIFTALCFSKDDSPSRLFVKEQRSSKTNNHCPLMKFIKSLVHNSSLPRNSRTLSAKWLFLIL